MKTKEITLCGKQVTLAYCFATEISFKLLAEQECTAFMREIILALQESKMPDTRKSIYLIMSAMTAYYESRGEKNPLEDRELVFHSSPEDVGSAIGTIAGLYIDFYKIPVGEPKEKEPADEKND